MYHFLVKLSKIRIIIIKTKHCNNIYEYWCNVIFTHCSEHKTIVLFFDKIKQLYFDMLNDVVNSESRMYFWGDMT